MKQILFIISFFCFLSSSAQDSLPKKKDSTVRPFIGPVNYNIDSAGQYALNDSLHRDSLALALIADSLRNDSIKKAALARKIVPVINTEEGKPFEKTSKDWIFYTLAGFLLFLGLLRMIFPRYFADLFRLFFNTTLKQMQVRERLLQADLPSLLLNIFFVLSGGMYLYLLMNYYGVDKENNHWLILGLTTLMLMGIYMVKFVGLKFSGWLFGMEETTDLYIFIVSLINKLIGISLLPFLVLMAYSSGVLLKDLIILSFFMIGAFFFIRFIRSYSSIRHQLKISLFHFFLYLLCFELVPLLIIYRSLVLYFQRSA